jgi:hypothetical protein
MLVVIAPVRADAPANQPIAVPFELLKTKHIVVQAKINNYGPYRLVFDTGAPALAVNNRIARATGILEKDTKPPALTLFGGMGQFPIKKLEIGDLKVENIATLIVDHPLVEMMAKSEGPIDGLVGFPVFARYRLTIDYQAKQLMFAPNGFQPVDAMQVLAESLMSSKKAAPRILAPSALWGLIIDKSDNDEKPGITIKQVLPNSAAAQGGLQPGDRLLTLDGRWTDSVNDCYFAASKVSPGTAAVVLVLRDGKEREFTVKPRLGW